MTDAKIALLLIEPENTEFGEGLTATVQAAAEEIVGILKDVLADAPAKPKHDSEI
jgi:hypothetical protein